MPQFQVENLSFTYPQEDKKALDSVSFDVHSGEYICICGKSGCGKTTLLRQFKSVLTPFGEKSGRVLFHGTPLNEVSQRDQSRFIGYVMQSPEAQLVTDKVWHELAFGLENLGTDQRKMRLRVAEMASYFGIQDWFHKSVGDLSGGQKQLLNLASIMAMQPSVLILDEPTSQLDPIAAADFLNTVRKINLELGTTIMITEHRLEDVFATADRVLVLNDGCVAHEGTPRAVAQALYKQNNDMVQALPAPVKIYHGVQQRLHNGAHGDFSDTPVTVREGRAWLLDYVINRPECKRALPESEIYSKEVADPVVVMKDVWFRYEDGPDVLRGLDLEVPRSTIFALVGGNGTGKSTTLKAMCGICKPYKGKISVLGKRLKDWKGNTLFDKGVALLPQDPQNLFVKKTVADDLQEMLLDMPEDVRTESMSDIATLCDITPLLDKHPYDLSGGEQQRAALAKVLLCKPQVLLLDEPTKGLDAFFKEKLASLLKRLVSQGVTVVLVSHDIEFCARYATSVSMFFDGSVITTNTPRRFFAENSFYTTAANRMSREVFVNAITDEDVIELCLS